VDMVYHLISSGYLRISSGYQTGQTCPAPWLFWACIFIWFPAYFSSNHSVIINFKDFNLVNIILFYFYIISTILNQSEIHQVT
jgi:hypothetical protein